MAKDLNCSIKDLMSSSELRKQLDLKKYVTEKTGLPTLTDILTELEKPGRDPRKVFEVFSFTDGVNTIADLKIGMQLPGIVTNVTNFGAFVDIGVHQDGLVHISHLSDTFIKDPQKAIAVQQKVKVTVVEVDVPRKRIGLSMKSNPFADQAPQQSQSRSLSGSAPKARPTGASGQGKPNVKSSSGPNRDFKPAKPKEKEMSMEEKLAMLRDKFKK
jgi:uncharacterized protein